MSQVIKKTESRRGGSPVPAGILVDRQILRAIESQLIGIDPFEQDCLEAATYDMRLGDLAAVSTATTPIDLREHGMLNIEPGAMAIVQTLEIVQLASNVAGRIGPKTDLLRRGVFASAGPQIDPGYRGRLIVNLINLSPRSFTIRFQEPFLTIEFHKLTQHADKPYHGEYQGRIGLGREELDILLAYQGPTLAEIYRGFGELKANLRDAATWTRQSSRILELLETRLSPYTTPATPPLSLNINSLEPEPYDLLQPIPVLLQFQDNTWTAGFFDANLHSSGETEQEAFENLRSLILDVFESLSREDQQSLGPEPARQVAVLRRYLTEKGR